MLKYSKSEEREKNWRIQQVDDIKNGFIIQKFPIFSMEIEKKTKKNSQ